MLFNTESRYGAITILFHWLLAILIVSNLVLGLYMVSLPDVGFNMFKIYLIIIHKEIGMLVLLLVVPRLLWRCINTLPQLPTHLAYWEIVAARLVHAGLYGCMIALPLTGWLMSSAADFPITFMNLVELQNLIAPNQYLIDYYIEIHAWIAYALIAMLVLHIGAALRHHFFYKDNILVRMLKWW